MSSSLQTVSLHQVQDYQFDIGFGESMRTLRADEPAPLGQGHGPSPVQLLAAAVGNCLSASLLFALRKFKQQPDPVDCQVQAEVGRNADGRVRVLSITATLTLGVPGRSSRAPRPRTGQLRGLLYGHSERAGGHPGDRARARRHRRDAQVIMPSGASSTEARRWQTALRPNPVP